MTMRAYRHLNHLLSCGALSLAFVSSLFLPVDTATAAGGNDFRKPGLLIGADDDNQANATIQPAGLAINQSLDNTDVLEGFDGNDLLIGLLGSDVLDGGTGDDILIGGPEGGAAPNKDVILGGSGNDVNIWAPGDGSDAFLGGEGDKDALVFGVIDKNAAGVPTLTEATDRPRTGVPTANVSGQGGFCRIDRLDRAATGYDFLVRFITRNDQGIKVTVRTKDVEQLFCTSQDGGEIVYADLTAADPTFVEVSLDEVRALNNTVGQIIR